MKFQNFELSAYQFLQMANEIERVRNGQKEVPCPHAEELKFPPGMAWEDMMTEIQMHRTKIHVQTIKLHLYDIQENEYIFHPYRTKESIEEFKKMGWWRNPSPLGGQFATSQVIYPMSSQIPPSQYPPSWQTTAPSNQWQYNSGPYRQNLNYFPDHFRIGLGFCWDCQKAYYCYV
jgi:hypothetical protein